MKKMIFIAASVLAFAACNKEVISTPEAGTGVVMLSVESDDCVNVATKASVPTTDFNVSIVNDEDQVVKSGTPGTLSVVVLPADTYVIKAENISEDAALTNNDGKGQLRMAGQCEPFALAQSQTVTKTVSCVPTNSKITVAFDALALLSSSFLLCNSFFLLSSSARSIFKLSASALWAFM